MPVISETNKSDKPIQSSMKIVFFFSFSLHSCCQNAFKWLLETNFYLFFELIYFTGKSEKKINNKWTCTK